MRPSLLRALPLLFVALGDPPVAAQDIVDRSTLRVCADPHNLPFSDEKKEGFENKIAEVMGTELGLKTDYAWAPQVIGFVRNTLRAHLCDLVMGAIAGYYRKRDDLPITLVPLPSEPGAARMEYHIAMGVRANEPEWRRLINAAILKRQGEMTAILRDFGVPLLNEQGELISP